MRTRIACLGALAAASLSAFAAADVVTIDLVDVASWDGLGDADNSLLTVDLAAALGLPSGTDVLIDGVGWDVQLETFGPSWLSEASIAFSGAPDLFLTPSGTDDPGIENLDSGGILDLTDEGLDDVTIAGGVLTLEFFESFDDVADSIDATWNGTLSLNVIPAPGVLALLGLAGIAGTRRRHG